MDILKKYALPALPLVVFVILAASCGRGPKEQEKTTPAGMEAGMMYGVSDLDWVVSTFPIFKKRMELIRPDAASVAYLHDLKKPVLIRVFMGTWCTDSQTYLPVLFRAVTEASNPRITMQIIGLDRRKKDIDGLAERFHVELSPTVIVENEGYPLGQVVEVPQDDMARDVVRILQTTLGG